MKWKVFARTPRGPRKSEAFISVGRNSLNVSAGAAIQIEDYQKYKHAEIVHAEEGDDVFLGIRLLESPTADSLPIRRKRDKNGKEINGITVSDKETLARAFGREIAAKNGMTRYDALRDLNYPNVLIIRLNQKQKRAAEKDKFNIAALRRAERSI